MGHGQPPLAPPRRAEEVARDPTAPAGREWRKAQLARLVSTGATHSGRFCAAATLRPGRVAERLLHGARSWNVTRAAVSSGQ